MAALLVAGPAQARSWGVLYAGSLAKGRGDFFPSGSTYASNHDRQYQIVSSSTKYHGAYVVTDYYFYGPGEDCSSSGGGSCWYEKGSHHTSDTKKHKWMKNYTHYALQPDADKARGQVSVCEDIRPWKPDKCSAYAYPSFSY